MKHWQSLKIINEAYAEAIALVGMGHRVVDLFDFDKYEPDFPVHSGNETVCLPYLAGILRLADELDLTNDRTPDLLYNEYFPVNKVSKEEWEKHKANYFVNFKNDTIKIRSKCHKKELYFALIKQYNKIEDVQKYIQKLTRILPQNDRNLQIKYSKLEKDIKSDGFIPKEIGFSFDLQNTIDTFIGDNIYNNKNVAIRECLQNSIDSCRYRKQLEGDSFEIKIEVILKENKLIICDNGLGMDDFIVENYFAKLAKSYYSEKKVLDSFEAISQFGVGVFSYFLLCDYFEVESKMRDKEPIKFLANRDADCYFHFSDCVQKESIGTNVTLILRDKLGFEEIVKEIKHYFRFIEFPINVFNDNNYECINSQRFDSDINIDFKKKYHRRDVEKIDSLRIIDVEIETEAYKGVLGILMNMDATGLYSPTYIYVDTLNDDLLDLSHKGIYVNRVDSFLLPFKWTIGKLNLKKKKALDLGRYHLKNSDDIISICNDFYLKIFELIFRNWETKSKKERVNLTNRLLDYYFNVNSYKIELSEELVTLFLENLYFILYNGSKENYVTLNDLKKLDEFIIVNGKTSFTSSKFHNKVELKELFECLNKKPILNLKCEFAASDFFALIVYIKWPFEILSNDKNWYVKINKGLSYEDSCNRKILKRNHIGYLHDKLHIGSNPKLDTSQFFNLNHPIIKYIIGNEERIINDSYLIELFDELLSFIADFLFEFHNSGIKEPIRDINIMNEYIAQINTHISTSFAITESDFPNWINEKINWNN